MSTEAHYIPAEPGWLALFEDQEDGGLVVRAEPVIAWYFANGQQGGAGEHIAAGRAVIGARPGPGRGVHEDELHCFALVREDQLETSFLDELYAANRRSREEILAAARSSQERRLAGHDSWVRDRRSQRSRAGVGVLRII